MSELVRVGRVGKPHGLDGSFFVEHGSEDEERFAVGATLHVDGEPAKVVGSKRSRGRPVIRLDRRVERGAKLAVPRDALASSRTHSWKASRVGLSKAEKISSSCTARCTFEFRRKAPSLSIPADLWPGAMSM